MSRINQRFGLLLLLCAAGSCDADSAPPQVRVGETMLAGRFDETQPRIAAFLGVPFAEAPVAELRWQAPRPLRASPGLRAATEFAAACYQDDYNLDWYRKVGAAFGAGPERFQNPPFSEDCLYLNIWTPETGNGARLPVMVWIHGGANRSGWSFEPNYRGGNLAARGGVVVVSIAYRHGVFGFFGHPELDGSPNFGLLDQIAALRWIQSHIGAFGGDAGNVTLFGESAGAADIGYLLASPAAAGLFRRAISQSGGYQMLERRSLADLEALGETLAAALPGRPDLAGLRRLDSSALLAAANSALEDPDWGPAVDREAVPAAVSAQELLRVSPVDLLVGTNRDEWYMYLDDDPAARDAAIAAMPAGSRPALRALADSETSVRRGHDRAVTFANMVCAGYLMAGAVQAAGGRARVYRFDRIRPGTGGERLRAYHGAEIPYVFDTHDDWLPTDGTDRRLTGMLMDYWANFARTGDPNADGLPAWPPYDVSDPRLMALGDAIVSEPAADHALCLESANALYGATP